MRLAVLTTLPVNVKLLAIVRARYASAALLLMVVPAESRSSVTLKRNVTVALGASVPPAVADAPVPTRTRTVRDAATNSAMSSPVASVLAPLLALPGWQ
jgi:hypothetical protein